MIDPAHVQLSVVSQYRFLSISRSAYYYVPVPENTETLALMAVIDTVFMDWPWVMAAGKWPGTFSVWAMLSGDVACGA